jgi:hypothetical protein
MRKQFTVALVAILLLSVLMAAPVMSGLKNEQEVPVHAYTHSLSSCASITPSIDGVVTPQIVTGKPGEWDDAAMIDFTLEYRGEHHDATLYVKNDHTSLYLAFIIRGEDYNDFDAVRFEFDNDHDGVRELGDNILYIRGDSHFVDSYIYNPSAGGARDDTLDGGTNDYIAAVGFKDGTYTFEIAYPLNTVDDTHDFSLSIGDTVGFNLIFFDYHSATDVDSDTWPSPLWSEMAEIIIACSKDIYFADAKESPGSVYRYKTTTGIEKTIYTRPSQNLYSFTFHPAIPEKLYYVNANENKIYRTHRTASGWAPEAVVYTHTTYVRDIAFAFDKNGELCLYFSEATGAAGNGKIYKIEDSSASLYYVVKLADVDGSWAGNFAFDDKNNLYLSSGNCVPARIYKVDGGVVKKIYKDVKEPISGLVYADGALYYANWQTKIYRLDRSTGKRTVVYSNPKRTWLSDVGFREIITPEKPDLAYLYSTDTTSANSYKSLLDANGFSTTLIPMSNVATTDFSKYAAIISGSDTGSMSNWGNSASVSAVRNSHKPIIGLGDGGYALFGQLKLDTGHPHGWHGNENRIYIETQHAVFKTPNAIAIPKSKIIRAYTSTQHVGIHLPTIPSNIVVLGREVESTNHYLLTLERDKYLLWGFSASPASMTDAGKNLFINVVSYMTD